jgi:cobalt-zinc-cadmium efflux system protein
MPSAQTKSHSSDHAAHNPGYGHAPAEFSRDFAIGIGLNTIFVIVEFVSGLIGNSVALVADTGHNLSDVLGFVNAWIAAALAQKAPSKLYTSACAALPFWRRCSTSCSC